MITKKRKRKKTTSDTWQTNKRKMNRTGNGTRTTLPITRRKFKNATKRISPTFCLVDKETKTLGFKMREKSCDTLPLRSNSGMFCALPVSVATE